MVTNKSQTESRPVRASGTLIQSDAEKVKRERGKKKNKAIKLPASETQRKMKSRSVLQNSNPPKKKNEKKKKELSGGVFTRH